MRFIAEGFEGEAGRSVIGDVSALVSALPYVIGYKADGDLRYIDMKRPRAVDLVAVDPQLNRIAIENVTLNLIVEEYVSVLKKQENGNYVYESVLKERPRNRKRFRSRPVVIITRFPLMDREIMCSNCATIRIAS